MAGPSMSTTCDENVPLLLRKTTWINAHQGTFILKGLRWYLSWYNLQIYLLLPFDLWLSVYKPIQVFATYQISETNVN